MDEAHAQFGGHMQSMCHNFLYRACSPHRFGAQLKDVTGS